MMLHTLDFICIQACVKGLCVCADIYVQMYMYGCESLLLIFVNISKWYQWSVASSIPALFKQVKCRRESTWEIFSGWGLEGPLMTSDHTTLSRT